MAFVEALDRIADTLFALLLLHRALWSAQTIARVRNAG
jgi:hypothetical protein